ncbi:GntR family transcriptional regulator [Streptomyces sp. NPDC051569]|uniref:GntR family transcriptional regulator n=1 Tax=Streptomyces sp. NPDC051569 TaxID=3365661 RepID=UPI00379E763C
MTRGTQTRVEAVYESLRADILSGRLAPGSRLKFPELGERYGVSVGAAREALTRLTSEGFVLAQPRHGYQVRPLTQADLIELTDARLEIEALVFRRSVQDGDMRWESEVVAAHHVLERTPLIAEGEPPQVTEGWSAAHAHFHLALLAGCRNGRLLSLAQQLRGEAELYRRWSVSMGSEPDRDLAADHRELMEAAVARDAGLASDRLRRHISHTTRLLLAFAREAERTDAADAS